MKIISRPYGEIEINENQKLFFSSGILGFENMHNYALLDAVQHPFYWLQSLDVSELAFILINPLIFCPEYKPDVLEQDLQDIGLDSNSPEEDKLLFTIVTIPPEDQRAMTANLQGPLIINKRNHQGRQCITLDDRWKTKHRILDELGSKKEPSC